MSFKVLVVWMFLCLCSCSHDLKPLTESQKARFSHFVAAESQSWNAIFEASQRTADSSSPSNSSSVLTLLNSSMAPLTSPLEPELLINVPRKYDSFRNALQKCKLLKSFQAKANLQWNSSFQLAEQFWSITPGSLSFQFNPASVQESHHTDCPVDFEVQIQKGESASAESMKEHFHFLVAEESIREFVDVYESTQARTLAQNGHVVTLVVQGSARSSVEGEVTFSMKGERNLKTPPRITQNYQFRDFKVEVETRLHPSSGLKEIVINTESISESDFAQLISGNFQIKQTTHVETQGD